MAELLNRTNIDESHTDKRTMPRTLKSDFLEVVEKNKKQIRLAAALGGVGVSILASGLFGNHASAEKPAPTPSVALEHATAENTIDTFTLNEGDSIIGDAIKVAKEHHIDLDTVENGINENYQGIVLTANETAKEYPDVAQPGTTFALIESADPDNDGIKSIAVAYEPHTK